MKILKDVKDYIIFSFVLIACLMYITLGLLISFITNDHSKDEY